ncbi:Asp-tRNA(Asn)/Glu-tRNA(Gln) amidotransferase subunit GatC [Acetilactobacillus jinshanensis]|uniref:Aspartyl/glutamyl-tRNA(Asn/Gln) amidotransferase subunit C n=1 Tax=Acetilactobacillus jinshanensis TaxID=1720083 RepID=A0A4V1ALJ9_9LACO|nr:Asp-tRNA(Asn)/Glu-tRNA(Gln) amidotransferase subunit GatC [Acetilactobacillus jinshanensis]QBP17859.1 Asp-tRNA(Asn)/Glu-tRNA(Gln) amidotransferase subunit GatC [Acetilactobacillus jinshanensis]URL60721.1 Asp-tRNA(Asn)/Glu-tRNA(Gln) amidotransferase subunit GatC [uncultured bacterium]
MTQKIDDQEVQKVAHLAKLNFSAKQLPYFTKQIQSIMKMFKTLSQVDTSNVKPTYSVTDQLDVTRPDVPEDWGERNALLMNAPKIADGFIKVPVIVKQQKNERK